MGMRVMAIRRGLSVAVWPVVMGGLCMVSGCCLLSAVQLTRLLSTRHSRQDTSGADALEPKRACEILVRFQPANKGRYENHTPRSRGKGERGGGPL